jgi:hypothetical protein
MELQMDFVSLAFFSVAVVGLGAAATAIFARWLPKSAIEQAAVHGRFVGLGEAPVVKQPAYRPQVRKEVMNVVRTSN